MVSDGLQVAVIAAKIGSGQIKEIGLIALYCRRRRRYYLRLNCSGENYILKGFDCFVKTF